MAELSSTVGVMIEALARSKVAVEDRVRLLRAALDDESIDMRQMLEAQRRYANARAGVNAILERLTFEVTQSATENLEATMAEASLRAGDGMRDFVTFADQLTLGGARNSSVAEAVAGLAEGLVKGCIEIWKFIRRERTAANRELADRLSALRWSVFEEI